MEKAAWLTRQIPGETAVEKEAVSNPQGRYAVIVSVKKRRNDFFNESRKHRGSTLGLSSDNVTAKGDLPRERTQQASKNREGLLTHRKSF